MKLQNTLDLSTFEIVRFRIWNQTSIPDDFGIGTKYFNTNSGHEGYNRENIYTETGWRRTAYMDDIEALTNGEGSLGTRVKALEDMLGLEDVTDVIDTWNDVKEFFDNVDEGLNLMDLLNSKANVTDLANYLPLSGGTINGNLDINSQTDTTKRRLLIWYYASDRKNRGAMSVSENNVQLDYYSPTDEAYYYIRIGRDGLKYSANYVEKDILHSGNVREYNAGGLVATSLDRVDLNSLATTITKRNMTIHFASGSAGTTNDPFGGGAYGMLNIPVAQGYTLQLAAGTNQKMFARVGDTTSWFEWKTIAFTDSTVEAAKKLVKSTGTAIVTIDDSGTTNFAGGIAIAQNVTFDPTYGISWRIAETNITNVATGSTGNFILGNGGAVKGYNTYLDGGTLYFRTYKDGASQTAMTITEEGNVNVGEGGLNVAGNIVGQLLRLGNESSAGTIFFDRPSANYIWASKAGGVIHMGVQDTGGTSSSNATLSIHKDYIRSGDRNNAVSLGSSSFRWSNVYSVGGDFSGRVLIGGAEDDGGSALQVKGTALFVAPDWRTETVKISSTGINFYGRDSSLYIQGLRFYEYDGTLIGHMGYYQQMFYIGNDQNNRWFDVKGSISNFNVLTNFNAGAFIPTGQTLTIGSVTFRETAEGEIEVDGNLHTTGTLASGGKGEAGTGSTGNAQVYQYTLDYGQSSYTIQNVKGSTNVIVQIYEWNSNTSSWDMILTDVNVKASGITVTFGRTTTVNHMVTVC